MGGPAKLAGAGLDVAGMFLTLISNEQQSRFEQQQARENATLADRAAADALQRGGLEAGKVRVQGGQLAAQQQAAYAASGVDPTVGTAANVSADSRAMAELDARTAENNAAREAWGFQVQAKRLREGAEREAAALPLRQVSTVLTGAGRVASRFEKQRKGE